MRTQRGCKNQAAATKQKRQCHIVTFFFCLTPPDLASFDGGGEALSLFGAADKALFSSKIFDKMSTVAISFVFDKYCPIMD